MARGIAVQVLPSEIDPSKIMMIREYLKGFTQQYFKINIIEGVPEEFLQQLRNRWLKVRAQ